MSRKQYSKELKLELVKKHLPIKEHKGLKTEISFSFYGAKFFVKKISTHLLIMEVDFCPVLCIAEMPILRAFVAFSHFVWYRRISSNELQMV